MVIHNVVLSIDILAFRMVFELIFKLLQSP